MHICFLHDVNGPWVWPFLRLHASIIIIFAAFERHNISMHFHGVLLHTKAQFQFQGSWDVALWNPTLGGIPTEIRPTDSPFFAPVWEAVTKRAPACITKRVTLSFSRATELRLFLIQQDSSFSALLFTFDLYKRFVHCPSFPFRFWSFFCLRLFDSIPGPLGGSLGESCGCQSGVHAVVLLVLAGRLGDPKDVSVLLAVSLSTWVVY